MKITVAMPAYNASKYIKEMIESVLCQDFKDFELLMLDDGSTDNTFAIMQEYKLHPKVRVYRNRRNLGVGASRNKLIHFSKGKYICPCDADDIMLPGNLKRESSFLDNHPNYGAVYGDLLMIEVEGQKINTSPSILSTDCQSGWDLAYNQVHHPGSLIRKELILKVGCYDEEVYSVDDWDLWLKLAEITKIKHLKGEVYYIWRRHSRSLTRTDKQWQKDRRKICKAALKRRYGIEPN